MRASVRAATGTGAEAARARRASSHHGAARGSARHWASAPSVSAPSAACSNGTYNRVCRAADFHGRPAAIPLAAQLPIARVGRCVGLLRSHACTWGMRCRRITGRPSHINPAMRAGACSGARRGLGARSRRRAPRCQGRRVSGLRGRWCRGSHGGQGTAARACKVPRCRCMVKLPGQDIATARAMAPSFCRDREVVNAHCFRATHANPTWLPRCNSCFVADRDRGPALSRPSNCTKSTLPARPKAATWWQQRRVTPGGGRGSGASWAVKIRSA